VGGFLCTLLYLGIYFVTNLLFVAVLPPETAENLPDKWYFSLWLTLCYLIAMPATVIRRANSAFLEDAHMDAYDAKGFLIRFYREDGLLAAVLYGIAAIAGDVMRLLPMIDSQTANFIPVFVLPPMNLVKVPLLSAVVSWIVVMAVFTLGSYWVQKESMLRITTGSEKVSPMEILRTFGRRH
ncbi:MAG: hypothetical protein IJX14_00055, partial [Clostridia bacterium]|nr:hypothetical protein [Clostridia bacterium]